MLIARNRMGNKQKEALNRSIRYCRGWIRGKCNDSDMLEYIDRL